MDYGFIFLARNYGIHLKDRLLLTNMLVLASEDIN